MDGRNYRRHATGRAFLNHKKADTMKVMLNGFLRQFLAWAASGSLWLACSSADGAAGQEALALDSARNTGRLRLELNNDLFFADDSQFSNGFSLQYHGVCYNTWAGSQAPALVKWVGEHFPSLGDGETVVRYGQGIGQNLVTPADIQAEMPPAGDIPYAATLTYSLGWQSFNDQKASVFQATAGILGEEALGEQVQKFVHNDLGAGDDPKGWETQRDTEPVLNFSYEHLRCLGRLGEADDGWAGRL